MRMLPDKDRYDYAHLSRWALSCLMKALGLSPFDHLANALECPVDFFFRDGQRWRDSNHPVMRLLAEQSLFLQRFAIRPRRTEHLNANPQALAANLF